VPTRLSLEKPFALSMDKDKFLPVRQLLSAKDITKELGPCVSIHHVDITCDGCECEPIIGKRFRCTVCEDIDLCEKCTRALLQARIKIAQEVGNLPCPPKASQRRSKWISRIKSEDTRTKWSALQETVPCLHPSHALELIISGPERAVVYTFTQDTPNEESFAGFIEKIKPSYTLCEDAAWIHTSMSIHYTTADEEARILAALDVWENLVTSKRSISSSNIDEIAIKYDLKHGKWMLFPSCKEVDRIWAALSRSLVKNELGSCTEIKVSTYSRTDNKHVILAYTNDYKDQTDVYEVACAIKESVKAAGMDALEDSRMLYKADIYTHLNIYSKNPYNLKPTIYMEKLL
jgi:hypothetical protein